MVGEHQIAPDVESRSKQRHASHLKTNFKQIWSMAVEASKISICIMNNRCVCVCVGARMCMCV